MIVICKVDIIFFPCEFWPYIVIFYILVIYCSFIVRRIWKLQSWICAVQINVYYYCLLLLFLHPTMWGRKRCINFISLSQSLREVFSKPDVKQLKDDSEKIEMATAFDTMWTIMLALKEASIELQTTDTPLKYNVENTIGSDLVTSTIQSNLLNVSFEGLAVIALHFFFIYSSVFCREVYAIYAALSSARTYVGDVLSNDSK